MQTITENNLPAGAPPFAEHQAAPLILRGITWQTYESLLADLGEQSGLRLTYDQGTLEIYDADARTRTSQPLSVKPG